MCDLREDTYSVSLKYRTIRKRLDNLGYKQSFPLDALPLIEKLLADLIQTTESLKHFKSIAENNIENSSDSDFITNSHKHDNNTKLAHEFNQLSKELIEAKEHNLKVTTELKRKINKLESECNDLQLASSRNLKRIKDLEVESSNKSKRIQELLGKCCKPTISNVGLAAKRRTVFPLKKPVLEADPLSLVDANDYSNRYFVNLSKVEPQKVNIIGMAEKKIQALTHEVNKLKGELSMQTDDVCTMKARLAIKEKEISRLRKLLDNGRVPSKSCTCVKNEEACLHCSSKSRKYGTSSVCTKMLDINDIRISEQAKQNLEQELRVALQKQHEAMSQAMKLAERNAELEKEIKDIDHVALAVEADCNSTVKESQRKISQLQDKLEDSLRRISELENNLLIEKRSCHELRADLEEARIEKRNIQRELDNALEDNKHLKSRINNLNTIESNLKAEIKELAKVNHNQKAELTELKQQKKSLKKQLDAVDKIVRKSAKNWENANKAQEKYGSKKKSELSSTQVDECRRKISERDEKIKELETRIRNLECEKNQYRDEWNKLRNQQRSPCNDTAEFCAQICNLKQQLNEKEAKITELTREKYDLNHEKMELEHMYRTQLQRSGSGRNSWGTPNQIHSNFGDSENRIRLERLERERDNVRTDLERVKEERDIVRERLKLATEAHTSEQRRLKDKIRDLEIKLEEAERERQNVLLSQGSLQTALTGLEDQLENMKEELRRSKQELASQRTQYPKLIALQEQTNQSLSDVQRQLSESEAELSRALKRNQDLETQNSQMNNQVKILKQELNNLQANMTRLHAEKDQLVGKLDEKTERVADLESEIVMKEQEMLRMDKQLRECQKKNELCIDQSAKQERRIRDLQIEIENYRHQLKAISLDRENAAQENRRLQDDLASLTCGFRNLQEELETEKKASSDMKKQLQYYVGEIQRVEKMLDAKEKERNDILDEYQNLSSEAKNLEKNSYSLQEAAAETRGALELANNQINQLKRELANKDFLIDGLENQIAELSQNIASLESEKRQQEDEKNIAVTDLSAVRDLCLKLEKQKELCELKVREKNAEINNLKGDLARIRSDYGASAQQTNCDKAKIVKLETLLDQARREDINHQEENQKLKNELDRLKREIDNLQEKLANESSALKRWQNQAADCNKQLEQLRRNVTDERFDRALKGEEQRRNLSHLSKTIQISPNSTAEGAAGYSGRTIDLRYSPQRNLDQPSIRHYTIPESPSISRIIIPGYPTLRLRTTIYVQNGDRYVKLLITDAYIDRQNTLNNETIVKKKKSLRNMLKPDSERSTMTMKPPAKIIGYPEKSLRQGRTCDRRRRNPDIEACGCRKNEHLPGCHENHRSARELFATAPRIENRYDSTQLPSTSRQPEPVQRHESSYHPTTDIFDDDDDDEVIGPTPERSRHVRRNRREFAAPEYRPRRILQTTQPEMSSNSDEVIPDSRTHDDFPRRRPRINYNHRQHSTHRILPSPSSRENFYDLQEVIPDSPRPDFPRRRRTQNDPEQARNSQELIELINQTMQNTTLTVQEHLESIENKFDQITRLLNTTIGHEPIQQVRDAGIQYDVDGITPPNVCSKSSAVKETGTVTEPIVVDQQIPSTEQDRSHRRAPKNVRVTTRVHEEISTVEEGSRRGNHHQQSPRDDGVLYQAVSFHSIRHPEGSRMTMTTQTQRVGDDLINDVRQPTPIYTDNLREPAAIMDDPNWRDEGNIEVEPRTTKRVDIRDDKVCDTARCNNCSLPFPKIPVPMTQTSPRRILPTSTPLRPPARQIADREIGVEVTPPSPSVAQPVHDVTFDIPTPTFASQPLPAHLEPIVPETTQSRGRKKYASQGGRRQDGSSIPRHSYDLRSRPRPPRDRYGDVRQ